MLNCPNCKEIVDAVDDHVAFSEGFPSGAFTCGREMPSETLKRLSRDGLGGRREPGKDEL